MAAFYTNLTGGPKSAKISFTQIHACHWPSARNCRITKTVAGHGVIWRLPVTCQPSGLAQSFSLANMVPQAAKHNGGAWANSVEAATRKYAARATGNVYVITGPVFSPSIAQSSGIGAGNVKVPTYLFKLVYDEDRNRAWAHWHLNDDATRGSRPISYAELVQLTGVEFLPGVRPGD
jgi:DNA/RNA endonuclease G (NUC1)